MAITTLTRVLDADKHRLSIPTPSDTRHLTLVWPDQETADFTGLGVTQQHLVVALARVMFCVGVTAIGLIHSPPRESNAKPSGELNMLSLLMFDEPALASL